MTGSHLSTIAWSVHEAITVTNRPMAAPEITALLQRVWNEDLDLVEVEDAVQELVKRGRLQIVATTENEGERIALYDTFFRNAKGQRASPPPRIRDAASPHHGWF